MIRNYRTQKMWSICLLLIFFLLQFRIFLIIEACVTAFCYANFLATNWKRVFSSNLLGVIWPGGGLLRGLIVEGNFPLGMTFSGRLFVGGVFWWAICGVPVFQWVGHRLILIQKSLHKKMFSSTWLLISSEWKHTFFSLKHTKTS